MCIPGEWYCKRIHSIRMLCQFAPFIHNIYVGEELGMIVDRWLKEKKINKIEKRVNCCNVIRSHIKVGKMRKATEKIFVFNLCSLE